MTKVVLLVMTACLYWAGCHAQTKPATDMKKIEAGSMSVSWFFEEDHLIVEAIAPDDGWVAVGFNPKDDIVHTNLVMGGVAKGKPYLEDHYVKGFGNHQPVAALGVSPSATLISATNNDGKTTIRFSIPIKTTDSYHYDLSPGTEIYLICAFSMEDDLEHHSRMRKHVRVVL